MKIFNKFKGDKGENLALNHLKKKKYRILETNYHSNTGEIDIIAQNKEQIVFVEVKFRTSVVLGLPCEAVGSQKQYKIRKVAEAYIKENRLFDYPCRFDVIEVLDGKIINHIEDAF